jgi:phosphoglycolate phosphatase
MIQHVLFDLDGTLTDSGAGITRCLAHALEGLGSPCPPPGELTRFIGVPLGSCFHTLLGTSDEAKILAAIRLYRERFAERGMYENRLYPGVPEALAALQAGGRALWVVTAKPLHFAEKIVAHFGLATCFRGVFGPPLDAEQRGKGQLIGASLARWSLPPAETAMVGDRGDDVRGAHEHGLAAVAVLWGYGTRGELDEAGPDAMAESPTRLPEVVRGLEKRP